MKKSLPTLRTNIATWAVPIEQIPAVTEIMLDSLPPEDYDPSFKGQELETTYFDTPRLELRKNRLNHDKYITLRVRQPRHCHRLHGWLLRRLRHRLFTPASMALLV
jgi:hypothetical protein